MPGDAELLFCHGTVFDGHQFLPSGSAVRVRAGSIVAAEPDADARAAAGPGTVIVDLAGGTLLPGFIDAHMHPVFAGDQLRRCDLSGAVTLPATSRSSATTSAATPATAGSLAAAGRWRRSPAACRQPLRLTRSPRTARCTCRTATATAPGSTAALQLAGITRDTLDPADGRIERDAEGNPVGMLQEGARILSPGCCPSSPRTTGTRRCTSRRITCSPSASPAGRTRSSAVHTSRAIRSRLTSGRPSAARCAPASSARSGGTGTAAWTSSPS